MDLTTILGFIIGIVALIFGFIMEGGHLGSLFQGTAAVIVFGGTVGAVVAGTPMRVLKKVPYILKVAFIEKKEPPHETIDQLVELSNLSRREGLLALEAETERYKDDPFLYEGLQLTIDGIDGDLVRDILDREIEQYEAKHIEIGKVFETAGGYAPTMGIIGTVMGLVHVLGMLSEPDSLGPAIAVAFIATLYGVASANVLYFPLYKKIQARIDQQVMLKELQAEGLLSILHGENPNILRKKLLAFVEKKTESNAKGSLEESEAL